MVSVYIKLTAKNRSQQIFSVKGQRANLLVLAEYIVCFNYSTLLLYQRTAH